MPPRLLPHANGTAIAPGIALLICKSAAVVGARFHTKVRPRGRAGLSVTASTIIKTAITHSERIFAMEDWTPTSPLLNRRWLHFAQSMPAVPPAPMSAGTDAEPRSAASLPAWLQDTPWPVAPAPQPGPQPTTVISEDPFERFTIRTSRSVLSPGAVALQSRHRIAHRILGLCRGRPTGTRCLPQPRPGRH